MLMFMVNQLPGCHRDAIVMPLPPLLTTATTVTLVRKVRVKPRQEWEGSHLSEDPQAATGF